MASVSDLQVRITAKDELSPVIRRLTWQVWLFQHRDAFAAAVWTLIVLLVGVAAGHLL